MMSLSGTGGVAGAPAMSELALHLRLNVADLSRLLAADPTAQRARAPGAQGADSHAAHERRVTMLLVASSVPSVQIEAWQPSGVQPAPRLSLHDPAADGCEVMHDDASGKYGAFNRSNRPAVRTFDNRQP
jgi:hypothetical protein